HELELHRKNPADKEPLHRIDRSLQRLQAGIARSHLRPGAGNVEEGRTRPSPESARDKRRAQMSTATCVQRRRGALYAKIRRAPPTPIAYFLVRAPFQ